MHVAMVFLDGHKMSKSLGNLVFVDALRREWDPRAIRLALIAHRYRHEWEWTASDMPDATRRLAVWSESQSGRTDSAVIDDVRAHLDDDLDTPGALAVIDRAASNGFDVTGAARLLGVELVSSS
jgi:L-cysteine:1D-myo-inositol 2-amino-2-deoxy-alpha-D-glucopyranoside ligase